MHYAKVLVVMSQIHVFNCIWLLSVTYLCSSDGNGVASDAISLVQLKICGYVLNQMLHAVHRNSRFLFHSIVSLSYRALKCKLLLNRRLSRLSTKVPTCICIVKNYLGLKFDITVLSTKKLFGNPKYHTWRTTSVPFTTAGNSKDFTFHTYWLLETQYWVNVEASKYETIQLQVYSEVVAVMGFHK